LGVASALLREIRAHCRTDKLFTSANTSNVAAQSLFKAAGFSRSGVIENLAVGDPELVFMSDKVA
jgi:ribosomal protein S18 acetylase RimI-like enzyme